ncbi:GNAT family N-acetyltransferase [Blastococcus xanthinilyticus]|uniref:Acetyltransferase (GNAT) family protein n=1 Tax=Blastococcus xanthinilyticus TaxID=1564164 RepID=A0A5S5CUX3_9ACTN|nr:GNAT family N-acetyltransferase [Blastococcus xanthinilyticus]TYP86788.1 acetyltransferase (GNAT) family protein [Blastococcus xanthinilyticus]
MPAPPDPASVTALERLAARTWRGLEEQPYGDWLLRAGGGFTGRANSVLVLGNPPAGLPAAVADVTRWYRERGLPARACVPGPAADADAALAAAGWGRDEDTVVLTGPAGPWPCPDVPVVLADAPDEVWLTGYRAGGALPASATAVLRRAEQPRFASVRPYPPPAPAVAVARGAVAEDVLVISAVTVDERHRRRGLATALMTTLAADARSRGARCCVLQVTASNAPALALYARLGFTEHHRYHYRTAPPPAADSRGPARR